MFLFWFFIALMILSMVAVFVAIVNKKPDALPSFGIWLIAFFVVVIILLIVWRKFLPNDPLINKILGFEDISSAMPEPKASGRVEVAQKINEKQCDNLKTAQLVKEADEAAKKANEILRRRSVFQEAHLLSDTEVVDDSGAKIRDLPMGTVVKVSFEKLGDTVAKRLLHISKSENFVRISYLIDNLEEEGNVRQSVVSSRSLLEEKGALGYKNATWWDFPTDDKNLLIHKAVRLAPGQTSEQLVYVFQQETECNLYRPSKNVQFTAWINGEKFDFGLSGQKLPSLKDFICLRVQLSPLADGESIIRFEALKK